MLSSIFKKKPSAAKRKVNVMSLQLNDWCYYDNHKDPFMVTESGQTSRGVFFVEIKNLKSGKTHIFTDYFPVMIDES
jgi:hypothetical protein